jgi:hypothetical protein
MMEAVRASETSVFHETTRHYMPESCHFQLRKFIYVFIYLKFIQQRFQ